MQKEDRESFNYSSHHQYSNGTKKGGKVVVAFEVPFIKLRKKKKTRIIILSSDDNRNHILN